MSLFAELSHLFSVKHPAQVRARLHKALADPFEVLHRYYFEAPWLERKVTKECRD